MDSYLNQGQPPVQFEQFEHGSDVGIRGYGQTLEEAFQNAAKAMFDIMVDVGKVQPRRQVEVNCRAFDTEELFVEWLNSLLAQAGMNNMVFSDFKVGGIKKLNSGYELTGFAAGEQLNLQKHRIKIEVKGATYAQLRVREEKGRYVVQTVVDV